MSDANASTVDRITVEFPPGRPFHAVGRLVLGGVASRLELPVDRVEELGLALDALGMHELCSDDVQLEVVVDGVALRATLGEFSADPLADADVVRVVSALVDESASGLGALGHRVTVGIGVPPRTTG